MTTSNENEAHGFKAWVAANLWQLICAAFVFGGGYMSVNSRINTLEQAVVANQQSMMNELRAIREDLQRNEQHRLCMVRTLDKLSDRAGIQTPCELGEL